MFRKIILLSLIALVLCFTQITAFTAGGEQKSEDGLFDQLKQLINGEALPNMQSDADLVRRLQMMMLLIKDREGNMLVDLMDLTPGVYDKAMQKAVRKIQSYYLAGEKVSVGNIDQATMKVIVAQGVLENDEISWRLIGDKIDLRDLANGLIILTPKAVDLYPKELIGNLQKQMMQIINSEGRPRYAKDAFTSDIYDEKMAAVVADFQIQYLSYSANDPRLGMLGGKEYGGIKSVLATLGVGMDMDTVDMAQVDLSKTKKEEVTPKSKSEAVQNIAPTKETPSAPVVSSSASKGRKEEGFEEISPAEQLPGAKLGNQREKIDLDQDKEKVPEMELQVSRGLDKSNLSPAVEIDKALPNVDVSVTEIFPKPVIAAKSIKAGRQPISIEEQSNALKVSLWSTLSKIDFTFGIAGLIGRIINAIKHVLFGIFTFLLKPAVQATILLFLILAYGFIHARFFPEAKLKCAGENKETRLRQAQAFLSSYVSVRVKRNGSIRIGGVGKEVARFFPGSTGECFIRPIGDAVLEINGFPIYRGCPITALKLTNDDMVIVRTGDQVYQGIKYTGA